MSRSLTGGRPAREKEINEIRKSTDCTTGKMIFTKLRDKNVALLVNSGGIAAVRVLRSNASKLGGIYLGKIQNVAKNIDACFVEIAPGELCFLPLREAGTAHLTNRQPDGSVKAGEELEEIPVAYDALAVVVHPSNPVKQLTRRQLEDIFRGKITNWKQVGGDDRKIVVYSRETSSGTYEFFKESVLKNKNYMSSSLSMPATGAVIQSVSQTKGAIGYVGLAYLSPRVKAIAVSYDDGKHYVLPSLENGKKKLYPVVRPLYYYYNVANKEKVTPFIDYILSPEGQNIIKNGGYIPVK